MALEPSGCSRVPCLWPLPTPPSHRGSLRPRCLPRRQGMGGQAEGGERGRFVVRRCSRRPLKRGLLVGAPSTCLPVIIHLSWSPWWLQAAPHRVPEMLLEQHVPPRLGGALKRQARPHRGGAGCEEGRSDATHESHPKGQWATGCRKGRELTGGAVRGPPEPSARHTLGSPERSVLVGPGSNPRSCP